MPTLFFPDLEALRLCLARGVVPPGVARSPAVAGFDAQGHLWLTPDAPLHREALVALARLGVQAVGSSAAAHSAPVSCWQEPLPLVPEPLPVPVRGPVLFEVPAPRLPHLVGELRRLSRCRVGLRWLPGPPHADPEQAPPGRVLVCAVDPPYYPLARVLQEAGDGPEAPRAYYEQVPRVWVEIGHRHPLGDQLRPTDGHILLLRPPARWVALHDLPFAPELDAFPLPPSPVGPPREAHFPRPVPVPLGLTAGGTSEPAELWVLTARPGEQLATLVRSVDDGVLDRFSFAWTDGEEPVLVLRQRPAKQPVELVLDGEPYRPFLKLSNLFVPCGRRLQPPLRRDAVRRLLADDPSRVVWLRPAASGGRFRAESLPESAFRPLREWIAYESLPPATLLPWQEGPRWELEPFEVRDPEPTPPRPSLSRPAIPPTDARPAGWLDWAAGWFGKGRRPEPAEPAPPPPPSLEERLRTFLQRRDEHAPEPEPTRRTDWQERRHELENRFLQAPQTLSATERLAAWPELAALYSALNNSTDAALCWLNALWELDAPTPLWAWGWLRAEAKGTRWNPADGEVDRLLYAVATPATVRTLAAYLVWAAGQDPVPAQLLRRLDWAQQVIEAHDAWLPLRASWLASVALARLTHGDSLGLARAYNRVLDRLYADGLSLDLDLPGFLRFAGHGSSERFQTVRDWLLRSRDLIHRFLARRPPPRVGVPEGPPGAGLQAFGLDPEAGHFTRAYADLTLAWGLARLGEQRAAADHLQHARVVLEGHDDVHTLLLDAYAFRIQQALQSRAGSGPLPADWLARLERLDPTARYKVNKLRERSRVLSPAERVNAYGPGVSVGDYGADDLGRRLAALLEPGPADTLVTQVRSLLASASSFQEPNLPGPPRAVLAALDLAPRLGEEFGRETLLRVPPLLGQSMPVRLQARLLEKGLIASAHFGLPETARELVAGYGRLLEGLRDPRALAAALPDLEPLAGQCVRSLRRLGLRDEISRLLQWTADWVLQGADLSALRRRHPQLWPAALRALLHVASGWLVAGGRENQAVAVLDAARELLWAGELVSAEQRTLARTYCNALGQAPIGIALGRVEEVFQRLRGVHDTMSTNSHYALSALELVETVVTAVVHDDFTLGPVVRRWLDDEEFLIRRRVHRDLRSVLGPGDGV